MLNDAVGGEPSVRRQRSTIGWRFKPGLESSSEWDPSVVLPLPHFHLMLLVVHALSPPRFLFSPPLPDFPTLVLLFFLLHFLLFSFFFHFLLNSSCIQRHVHCRPSERGVCPHPQGEEEGQRGGPHGASRRRQGSCGNLGGRHGRHLWYHLSRR